jgi:hypothetical protein
LSKWSQAADQTSVKIVPGIQYQSVEVMARYV